MTAQLTIETFPNEAAADYIRGKAVADPKNFGNLPPQLKQRAFTVAGIEQMDVLRRMRDIIARLPEGTSWDEAKRDLASEISPFLDVEDGKRAKAARARAEHLLRIHGAQAYAVSRHQEQMGVVDRFPYWQYETVGDANVRASHAALDGKVLRADDPWWKTHYPPWDWGCRCIVHALDEEDAREIGISEHNDMPMPERSEGYAFDASDASVDLDMLVKGKDDPDCRLFAAKCRRATVQDDGREPETMWDFMFRRKMEKTARALSGATQRDGKERAVVRDYSTGKQIGDVAVGDANGVKLEIPDKATVCTLHTHPSQNNTPSPADLSFALTYDTKAEYIAAGKQLRRWTWLKRPEKKDEARIAEYDRANKTDGVDWESYIWFLERLEANGYIKMEALS